MEYKLVVAEYAVDLTDKINKWLRQGWSLYGDPFLGEGYLYQAMTKPYLMPMTPPFNTLPGQIGVTQTQSGYSLNLDGDLTGGDTKGWRS